MGVYIDDNKLVIIAEPRGIRFNLTKKTDNSRKYKSYAIIGHNEFLPEGRIKNEISRLLL